ncbi:MAG: GlsB/YeaQ/YmgE family stress response membrane protein [Reyranellales bacterium]
MVMSNESTIVILVVGIVAGWLAGQVVRGTGFGLIGDLLVGIAGAFIAAWLFPRFGIQLGTGMVQEILYSALGAVILLVIVRLIRGRGRF